MLVASNSAIAAVTMRRRLCSEGCLLNLTRHVLPSIVTFLVRLKTGKHVLPIDAKVGKICPLFPARRIRWQ
jgi:hypothetical protein